MEKISRIIPPSPRTQSADLSMAAPVRPGSHQIGKIPPVEDRVSLSSIENGRSIEAPMTYNNKGKESRRAILVDELSKKFFLNNPKTDVRGSDRTNSEEILDSVNENLENRPSYSHQDLKQES